MSNTNLHKAAKAKNDEFYTQYKDVEAEVKHYNLKDMVVYCNCDNPTHSNFYKYFKDNFHTLQIKHLYATGYNKDGNGYYGEYDGENETIKSLNGNGDFQSEESIEILNKSDVVITNPPFSLFRPYMAQLMEYEKKFLIIGNGNAVTYKEIFPLIKNNKIWLGASKGIGGKFCFIVPETYENKFVSVVDGKRIGQVNNACWFTNIDHINPNKPLILTKTYNPTDYPKYDNYDAINVDKVKDIPIDYDGVMGVPITFLDKYCPSQFEILGITNNSIDNAYALKTNTVGYSTWASINGKNVYSRLLIKKNDSLESVEFEIVGIANDVRWIGDFPCLTKINGNKIYNRILIKKR